VRLLTNERRTLPREGHAYWSVNLTVPSWGQRAHACLALGSSAHVHDHGVSSWSRFEMLSRSSSVGTRYVLQRSQ
jgi:hypothetical protein